MHIPLTISFNLVLQYISDLNLKSCRFDTPAFDVTDNFCFYNSCCLKNKSLTQDRNPSLVP